ncbi:LamG domain-containing protein [Candidatus Poribacteria bacterium]
MKYRSYYLPLLMATAIVTTFLAWDAAAELTDGLVLYLSFEERDPIDHSPDPAQVSVEGNLDQEPGKFGNAAVFDGATYLEVVHADKLDGMGALSIAAWVTMQDLAAVEGMSIASKRVASATEDVYNLFFWTGQKLYGRVNAQGEISSQTVFEDDTWYHVAFVFDGQKGKLYVDGNLEVESDHPENAVNETAASLWIGELDPNRGFKWIGAMDEVGIWNKALSDAEIALLIQGEIMAQVEPQGKLTATWGAVKGQ